MLKFKILLLSFIIALMAVGCGITTQDNSGDSGVPNPQNVQFVEVAQVASVTPIPTTEFAARPTYTVQRGDVINDFTFTGRWLPRDQMQLSFSINGTIRQVNVRRGDAVSAGDLIADYQITDLENQLANAKLSLETAISNQVNSAQGGVQSVEDATIGLANAQLNLQGTNAGRDWVSVASARDQITIAERNLAEAQRNYNEALSHPELGADNVDNAYQQVLQSQDSLRSAERQYFSAAQNYNNYEFNIKQQENSVISAQLNLDRAQQQQGVVSDESVRSAQLQIDQLNQQIKESSLYAPIDGVIQDVFINPGDSVSAFNAVITIALPEPKEVIANLAIGDAQDLSIGMTGVCNIVNQPQTAVGCAVRYAPFSAQDADQTTRVAAALENVTDGQLIEVTVPLEVQENVLWLPPAAIRTFQNRTFVVLDTPDGPRTVDIQIGLQTDERVEIISGVSEGDVAIAP